MLTALCWTATGRRGCRACGRRRARWVRRTGGAGGWRYPGRKDSRTVILCVEFALTVRPTRPAIRVGTVRVTSRLAVDSLLSASATNTEGTSSLGPHGELHSIPT